MRTACAVLFGSVYCEINNKYCNDYSGAGASLKSMQKNVHNILTFACERDIEKS